MDVFSLEFLSALLSIVIIDLVLAGDNAIVIGLAARNVPKDMQRKVIILGTLGAVVIRIIATLIAAYLLNLAGLRLLGGLLLFWIAYKLLLDEKDHEIKASPSVMGAIWTIIVADAAMGLDNVLAVAGAAQGHFLLVIAGLLISIPIVVWGSTLFIKLLGRFPWILYVGSGILAYTAAKMVVEDRLLHDITAASAAGKWLFIVISTVLVVTLGYFRNKANKKNAIV